jgi:hypothetical protein
MSLILLTRLKAPCVNCLLLKKALEGAPTRPHKVIDADSVDGMVERALYSILSTPALIDDETDVVIVKVEDIVEALKIP